jgi:F-type H+-transporting ATPase subunit a
MSLEVFGDPVLARVGPVPITRTMVTSAFTTAGLAVLSAIVARAARVRPSGRLAAGGRLAFRFLHDLAQDTAGRASPLLEAFAGGLFVFITGAAIVGQLPGVPAPTSNLAATSALAALVFLAVPLAGISARGVRGYLAHYVRPNPLLLPLHVISELSRTVALALRLFGNMMSGHVVVALIVALVGPFVPVPLMALDLLIGLLQAYIFTVLACVYIGAAIRVGEGE